MTTPIQNLLADALDALVELHQAAVPPAQARPWIAERLAGHADWQAELVWQIDPFDHTPHYDLLLRGADLPGTIALTYGPDQAVPWPLRGVQHAKERDLLRVNDTVMEIQEGMGSLDVLWNAPHLLQRLIDTCLIGEALAADPIAVSDAELQAAMDGFRRARGLLTTAATRRWLVEHGMSLHELEQHVEEIVKLAVLRERIAAAQIGADLAATRADVEQDDPAAPDATRRKQIEHEIFEEWLAERRADARIEWFWGDVRRTAAATPSDGTDPMRPLRPAWSQAVRA